MVGSEGQFSGLEILFSKTRFGPLTRSMEENYNGFPLGSPISPNSMGSM